MTQLTADEVLARISDLLERGEIEEAKYLLLQHKELLARAEQPK